MVNKVTLIGNIGADPEIRRLDNGSQVAKFRLVTTERYKDKSGQQKELNEWHNIEAWGAVVGIIEKYVKKGDKLYLEGQIHYEEYNDKNGEKRYMTVIRLRDIKLLTPKKQEETQQPMPPSIPNYPAPEIDDLPFD